MPDYRSALRLGRRAVLRRRRVLIAVTLAAAAVAFAEQVSPPPPPQTSVVVAGHDLRAGITLGAGDVRLASMPDDVLPAQAATSISSVLGETVAGPMRAGEVLTDRRVVAPSLIGGYPAGTLAAPVRVHDEDVVSLLEAGDSLDVYAADPDSPDTARLLVSAAPVVTIPDTDDDRTQGGLIVLAVDRRGAARLAQTNQTTTVSVVLRD